MSSRRHQGTPGGSHHGGRLTSSTLPAGPCATAAPPQRCTRFDRPLPRYHSQVAAARGRDCGADGACGTRIGRSRPACRHERGCRAVPQTAFVLLLAKRYSSVLPNFGTRSPGDSDTTTEIRFCAPPADRPEGTVPVHNGGSVRASLWTIATQSNRTMRRRVSRPGRAWADSVALPRIL